MQLINLKNIKKFYGDRKIFEIEDLSIFENDRIGIVGVNGSGKTTLLNLIYENDYKDNISIDKNVVMERMTQLENNNDYEKLSGGEKTKKRVIKTLKSNSNLLLLDEPTNNLDLNSIEDIIKEINKSKKTMVIISHNRDFLDNVCNKIFEIDNGKISIYKGTYSDYFKIKEEEINRNNILYNKYEKEKNRLESLVVDVKEQSRNIRKTPKRMGNSEARLHRMGGQKNKAKVDKFAKSLETKIEQLEKVDKYKENKEIKLEIIESSKIYSRILVEGKDINFSYKDKIIFQDANIQVYNNRKIAIIGDNGSGKSTFINMIIDKDPKLKISKKLKIGYFNQKINILDKDKSILENILEPSAHNEDVVRKVLGRFLIKGEKVNDSIENLSGGELVKISLCKIILQDINFLVLDEITNHLDLNSISVLEEALKETSIPMIFVSHDKKFIDSVANSLILIKDKKITTFDGSYSKYLESLKEKSSDSDLLLKNKLSELIGRISIENNEKIRAELDREYKDILEKLYKKD